MPDWIAKYWLEWVFGLLLTLLGGAYARLRKRVQRDHAEAEAMKTGMRGLLRMQIIHLYRETMQRGSITVAESDTVRDMYNAYHTLGGNGTITAMKDEIGELPIKN